MAIKYNPKKRDPNKLTLKENNFVREYIKNNGNASQAMLKSYNVTKKTAAQSARNIMAKPRVENAIKEVLDRQGLNDEFVAEGYHKTFSAGVGNKATNSDAIRVLENLSKMRGIEGVHKSASLNINLNNELDSLSYSEVVTKLKEQRDRTSKILQDIGE